MKELQGCHIKQIFKHGDTELYFKLADDSVLGYEVLGDCCSQAWFHHLEGTEALLDAVAGTVEQTSDFTKWTDCSRLIISIIKFKTNKGWATLEYRNESNGYYCGWCELITDPKIGDDFEEVTKDF